MSPLLEVARISKSFGGLRALADLSFSVEQGQIFGLIGPNGAGKTTAFNLISGTLAPTSGRVRFDGRDITGMPPSRVVRLGLVRTFQATSFYPKATVADNVLRGALSRVRTSLANQLLDGAATRAAMARARDDANQVIDLLGLSALRGSLAGNLPYGHQKRLGVAIGLATRPKMLLLDEPAAGLNTEESAEFGNLLLRLQRQMHLTVLLVEHHMALVMELCERIVVLVQGQKLAEAAPLEIRNDPAVVEAYLGAPEGDHA